MIGMGIDGVNMAIYVKLGARAFFNLKWSCMMNENAICSEFEILEHGLIAAHTPFSPAYLHGVMTGLLTTGKPLPFLWEQLAKTFEFLSNSASVLCKSSKKLFLKTAHQLTSEQIDLVLMLPEEDAPLYQRLAALGDWCEGFLEGLQIAAPVEEVLALNNVKEILSDFLEIKEVVLSEEENEQNERDLFQIVEFIRVGVLLVYAECCQLLPHETASFSHAIH